MFTLDYRRRRRDGTPPKATFEARLLHNRGGAERDRYVYGKPSTRCFQNHSSFVLLARSCWFEQSIYGTGLGRDTISPPLTVLHTRGRYLRTHIAAPCATTRNRRPVKTLPGAAPVVP
ncbi:unnamed protein product [Ectocarpus sp. 12 AP-2014]